MPYPGDDEILKDVAGWPRASGGGGSKQYCCVKKYPKDLRPGSFPSMDCFGMLIAVDGVVMNAPGTSGVTIIREQDPPLNYESFDAMLADGWVVD